MIAALAIGIIIVLAFGRRTRHYDVDAHQLIKALKKGSATTPEVLERTGGEMGLTADEHELARLRNENVKLRADPIEAQTAAAVALEALKDIEQDFPDMRQMPESVIRARLILEAQDRARAVLARGDK